MYCLAILDSGNYVFNLCSILEKKGYVFEVVSTPCKIAKEGCGYCIKLPEEFTDMLVKTGRENKLFIREMYKVVPGIMKNEYKKIY